MRRFQRPLIILGTLASLALLAACGSNIASTPASRGPSNPSAAPTTAAPSVVASSPTSTSTSDTGPIRLQTSASFYQASQIIVVTLSNQSSQTIYFPDHQTNCSVILLQRPPVQQQMGTYEPAGGISPCRLEIMTRIHSLGPGQSLVVKLVPPQNGWPAGLYLATLSYRTSPTIGPSAAVSSAAFAVSQ